jgi:hypothetical protein
MESGIGIGINCIGGTLDNVRYTTGPAFPGSFPISHDCSNSGANFAVYLPYMTLFTQNDV